MNLKRRPLALTVAVVALVLAACSPAAPDAGTDLLAELGLDGLSGQEIVDRLDTSPEPRPLAFAASVREDEVLISDGEDEVAVGLPEDLHYVSIAPYVQTTHDCYFHSLATCQGELVEQAVHVTITDADGAVLVDEDATTYVNGFVGFWVPRGTSGTIEVTADGRTGSVPFSTTDGDPTCVTTLRLT